MGAVGECGRAWVCGGMCTVFITALCCRWPRGELDQTRSGLSTSLLRILRLLQVGLLNSLTRLCFTGESYCLTPLPVPISYLFSSPLLLLHLLFPSLSFFSSSSPPPLLLFLLTAFPSLFSHYSLSSIFFLGITSLSLIPPCSYPPLPSPPHSSSPPPRSSPLSSITRCSYSLGVHYILIT